jgi:hypothetical protein
MLALFFWNKIKNIAEASHPVINKEINRRLLWLRLSQAEATSGVRS